MIIICYIYLEYKGNNSPTSNNFLLSLLIFWWVGTALSRASLQEIQDDLFDHGQQQDKFFIIAYSRTLNEYALKT